MAHEYSITNTRFQKTQTDLITYRSVGTEHFEGNPTITDYAQCDFILQNQPWKNACMNTCAKEGMATNSDHKMLITSAKSQLAKRKKQQQTHLSDIGNPPRSKWKCTTTK